MYLVGTGGGDCQINLNKNGVFWQSATITSGTLLSKNDYGYILTGERGDYITVDVVQGSGTDLSINILLISRA